MITHDDYVICSKTLFIIPFVVYFIMWGYGASREHCTCRLDVGLFVRVLYVNVMNSSS